MCVCSKAESELLSEVIEPRTAAEPASSESLPLLEEEEAAGDTEREPEARDERDAAREGMLRIGLERGQAVRGGGVLEDGYRPAGGLRRSGRRVAPEFWIDPFFFFPPPGERVRT